MTNEPCLPGRAAPLNVQIRAPRSGSPPARGHCPRCTGAEHTPDSRGAYGLRTVSRVTTVTAGAGLLRAGRAGGGPLLYALSLIVCYILYMHLPYLSLSSNLAILATRASGEWLFSHISRAQTAIRSIRFPGFFDVYSLITHTTRTLCILVSWYHRIVWQEKVVVSEVLLPSPRPRRGSIGS